MIKENEKVIAGQDVMLVTWTPGSKKNHYTKVKVHHVTPTGIIVLGDLSKYKPNGSPIKKRSGRLPGDFEELELLTEKNVAAAEKQLFVSTLKNITWDNIDLATLRLVMAALLTDSIKGEPHA